jgi:tetratricopeptide (TPR) repeat protein
MSARAPAAAAPNRMKRYLAATAAVLAALALARPAAPDTLDRARELSRRGEYDRARREIAADTAALKGTSLDEAMLMLARLETDASKAEALCRRAMTSADERTSQRARLELGKMLYASGSYREALESLSGEPPRGPEALRNETLFFAGLCRAQLGDAEHAANDFGRITRGPFAFWSRLAQAGIDAQAGRLSAAVETYEELGRSKPDPVVLFGLGECYETMGDREKALARYRALVEQFPRSLEAAKGKEKIALLTETREKPREIGPPEGGESGERRGAEPRTSEEPGRGFTLQFGAFETRANAIGVSTRLEKSLRGVRVESIEMDGRVWHRVRAGFYETREAAEKDAARAQRELGLTATVVPLK